MPEIHAKGRPKSLGISAVVTKADGTKVDLGMIAGTGVFRRSIRTRVRQWFLRRSLRR